MDSHIYSLTDIVLLIDRGFQQLFGGFDFWFKSEISRISQVNSKVYLELVEFDIGAKVKAKSKGIVFDINLWNKFLNEIKVKDIEELKGFELLFQGRLNFHKEYGISIIIDQMSSEYVLGQFQKSIDEIKKKLIKEEVYGNNKLLSISYPPYKIAAISSSQSAGFHDFTSILGQSIYKFNIKTYNSAIDGNAAKDDVYSSLRKVYKDIDAGEKIDFVVILRGGGSSDGILRQNDYNIARGICHMQVPVIVAVGHTQDRSLLSEIVKFDAKTPSEAAYFIVNLVDQYLERCEQNFTKINEIVRSKLQYYSFDIENKYNLINGLANKQFKNLENKIKFMYNSIMSLSPEKLLKYGYGVLKDMHDQVLNKVSIENLKRGDDLKLNIYDKKFIIRIVE